MFRWPRQAAPRVRIAGRFPLNCRDFSHIYRSHTHAIHLYDYHGVIRFADTEFEISPGVVTISPAGGNTSYHVPRRGHHLCVHFFPVSLAGPRVKIPLHLSPGPHSSVLFQRIPHIARLHQIASEHSARAATAGAAASAAMQEMLLYLAVIAQGAHLMRPQPPRSISAVDAVARLLMEEMSEPLDVRRLARRVGLSRDYLTKLFRARFGTTIPGYLQALRMEHAKQLLTDTNMPIKLIGASVGYPDPQHFNKRFRESESQSPSQYRRPTPLILRTTST
ncbi:MAG: helix-turn-helix transcriptional regulator [Planctomycetes bacterium]|nr:helix-turn-helix transcriptional regulator [Planctomycetota bacterium]